MITSKQTTKGERMRANKQRGTKGANTQTHKGKTTCEAWQGCKKQDLSTEAWIQTQKAWKRSNKAQTYKKELIQTLY